MSIRFKVILPYLLLTLIVALTGAYVVTRLVTNSLAERLTNQLLEAGRIVSDNFARQELQHIDNGRILIYTRGVAAALRDEDISKLDELVTPTSVGLGIENVLIVNMQAQQMLHLHIQSDGTFFNVTQQGKSVELAPLNELLDNPNPNNQPIRGIYRDISNERWYYFTALPFVENNRMLGVIVIGTPMETIMPLLKSTALSDVIIYRDTGKAVASTFQSQGVEEDIFLQTVSIPVDTYQEIFSAEELVLGQNLEIKGRSYSIARGKLQVGDDVIAVFAVVLPADYVAQTSAVNRDLYVVIFSVAMVVVVLLGYFIARLIINPLSALVHTSQAISAGDLTQRTGIRSRDEIGTLATTFDVMTENLQDRTQELERTNRILEQMDRTKSSFIHISAHEMRTPLTIIQGYAYMLQQTAPKGSDLESISNGLMEGFTRLEEVVNSMLDVSKIDSKSLKISKADTKLSLIIAKLNKNFQPALEERKLEFTTEGLDELPLILTDSDMLYKVFYHLVVNAIKYTPDGGKIKVAGTFIEVGEDGPEVEVIVQDTGIGIAKQNHETVFEKFFQTGEVMLHSSGKTKFKGGGPGLGLSIARGIIQAHGGRIWLDSPGYDEEILPGTTVYVRIPVDRKDA